MRVALGSAHMPLASEQIHKKSKKELLDDFARDIKEIVKQDAADGVYMSKKFCDINKSYLSKVGPDRKSAIMQVNQKLTRIHCRTCGSIVDILLGNQFWSEINVGAHMTTAEIFNAGGELIASYDSFQGWTPVPTQEESAFGSALTQVYSQMYDDAKAKLTQNKATKDMMSTFKIVDFRI